MLVFNFYTLGGQTLDVRTRYRVFALYAVLLCHAEPQAKHPKRSLGIGYFACGSA